MGHRCIFAIMIVLGVCVFSGNTLAQPTARKFDELKLGYGTFTSGQAGWQAVEDELKVHLARYVKQLRRQKREQHRRQTRTTFNIGVGKLRSASLRLAAWLVIADSHKEAQKAQNDLCAFVFALLCLFVVCLSFVLLCGAFWTIRRAFGRMPLVPRNQSTPSRALCM